MGREQVSGCERYEDWTILLRALVCNAVGEEGLSNDIKASEYRMRPYTIYYSRYECTDHVCTC